MVSVRVKAIAGIVIFTLLFVMAIVRYQSLKVEHPEAAGGFTMLEAASAIVYAIGVALTVAYMLRGENRRK